MPDASKAAAGLRERLTNGTEDKLGRALADLFDNPLVSGTIGRAFDARERAAQAQELALSALNIPTAADIERLTRRLRSVSQRLEGIEDGVHRLNRALSDGGVERRLAAMEEQLNSLGARLARETPKPEAARAPTARAAKPRPAAVKPAKSPTERAGAKSKAAEAARAAAKPAAVKAAKSPTERAGAKSKAARAAKAAAKPAAPKRAAKPAATKSAPRKRAGRTSKGS